jgi:hypothetical protein
LSWPDPRRVRKRVTDITKMLGVRGGAGNNNRGELNGYGICVACIWLALLTHAFGRRAHGNELVALVLL